MPRAYWKGYLRLTLVTCKVELYPATTQSEKTHFHQINTKTGNRLRQQMVDEVTGKPVAKDQKGRGYELSKGRYVPIEEEDLKAIEIESTRIIDIQGFVQIADIDKRYLDKPYYVAPADDASIEAFVVIRDAMKQQDRVALAKIVIGHREHIMMVEPFGKGMLGTTLRFEYEVRAEDEYFADIPSPRISKDMVDLASHIIAKKASKFDPRRFKDEYEAELKRLVQRKAKGQTIERAEPVDRPSNVIDLMEALRESVNAGKRKSPRRKGRPTRGRKAA